MRKVIKDFIINLFIVLTKWRLGLNGSNVAKAEPENILVVRLDEIGDAVLNVPFLRGLRGLYPAARITLVVKSAVVNIMELSPYVDRVVAYPLYRGRGEFLVNLYRIIRFNSRLERFDLAIAPRWDSDWAYRAGLIVLGSGALCRVGYESRVYPAKAALDSAFDACYTDFVPSRAGGVHEVVRGLDIIRYLGGMSLADSLELWWSDADFARAKELLGVKEEGAVRVAVALSAGGGKKIWPRERFGQVLKSLSEMDKYEFVFTGGDKHSYEAADFLQKKYPELRIINLVGKTTLRESAAALSLCDLYLGGDTGLMHIAVAVGIGGVVIFWYPRATNDAPYALSPVRFGPYSKQFKILQPQTGEPGCENGCIKDYPHCILRIGVDEVVQAVTAAAAEVCHDK